MKQVLTFNLWPEPPIPIDTYHYAKSPMMRIPILSITQILKFLKMRIVKERSFATVQREEGRLWPTCAHTMIGIIRLDNLQFACETVIKEGIKGDFIETGVWRGGACIFMRAILAAYGIEDRRVYVADSFEGLPKPEPAKYPADAGHKAYRHKYLAISQAEVENNFRKYGLLDDKVVFLKGWFAETLPHAPIEKLAILRLDGDMYSSTMDALTNLYHKLSSGGFCIIDDYALPECKAAVDDFRHTNGIRDEMMVVDWTGRYWRKK